MKRVVLGLIVLGLLGGGYAYYQFNRGQADMTTVKSEATVSAATIYKAFSENEESANAQYLGKTITVTGKVSASVTEDQVATVTLFADSELGGISCKLDPLTKHKRTSFTEGEELTVKGICTGYLMDVVLERCLVVE